MIRSPNEYLKDPYDLQQQALSIQQILQLTSTDKVSNGAAGTGNNETGDAGKKPLSALHLMGKYATHPDLKVAYQKMPEGIAKLKEMSLFRSISLTPDMALAVKNMMAKKPTTMPVMWGFRAYKPGQPLLSKEINTLKAIAADIQKLKDQGLNVAAPLILADLHAEHNNVPPDAVPGQEGGVGTEGYKAYYAKVAAEAAQLGIPTVKLSDVFNTLQITPDDIAARGAELVRTPSDSNDQAADANTTYLTENDIQAYTKQARHMVERYPTVPVNRQILQKTAPEKQQALENKALHYIHFRKGEGEILLPRLPEFFGNNVIPIHVSDPGAGTIGVEGAYIYSKSGRNKNVADIPWKGEGKDIINNGKLSEKEVKAAKLVTQALGLKYGSDFEAAVRVAVRLSHRGLGDTALVEAARQTLAIEQEVADKMSLIDKSAIARALSKETGLKGSALRDKIRSRLQETAKLMHNELVGKAVMERSEREASVLAEELRNYSTYVNP